MNAATVLRLLLALGMLMPAQVQAGRHEHGVSVVLSGEYDSNPSLVQTGARSIWRLSATPRYRLSRESGEQHYAASLGVRLERSSDAALSAERQDPLLDLDWRRETPTGSLALMLGYERASTRVTEFQDTGLVSADGSRDSRRLAMNLSQALDDRQSLSANLGYSAVGYSGGTLVDYSDISLSGTWAYTWDELKSGYLRLSTTRYVPDGNGAAAVSSRSHDAVLGLRWTPAQRWSVDLAAGPNRTVDRASRGGWQVNLNLDNELDQRTRLSVDLSRSVASSGVGGFSETDRLDANWRHALSGRWDLLTALSWRKSRTAATRETLLFELAASHALSELWSLRLGYLYRQREGAGLGEASGQVLSVLLSYSHPRFLTI